MNKYSIIVPTFNEEKNIISVLDWHLHLKLRPEIIVVDGGSRDKTVLLAQSLNIKIVNSTLGRGIQFNTGSKQAGGDIFIFLHSDTTLPSNVFDVLGEFFKDPRVELGTFRLKFDVDHWLLSLSCFFTRFDSLWTSFGDQGIVVRKSFFEKLGGFPDWSLFEDVEFLRRARKVTKIYSFPATATTSSRRFQRNGVVRQHFINAWLILRYLFGADPQKLAIKYRKGDLLK